jgi:hypothetical protein
MFGFFPVWQISAIGGAADFLRKCGWFVTIGGMDLIDWAIGFFWGVAGIDGLWGCGVIGLGRRMRAPYMLRGITNWPM